VDESSYVVFSTLVPRKLDWLAVKSGFLNLLPQTHGIPTCPHTSLRLGYQIGAKQPAALARKWTQMWADLIPEPVGVKTTLPGFNYPELSGGTTHRWHSDRVITVRWTGWSNTSSLGEWLSGRKLQAEAGRLTGAIAQLALFENVKEECLLKPICGSLAQLVLQWLQQLRLTLWERILEPCSCSHITKSEIS